MDVLFEPLRVGPRTLRNRFVMTPHGGRIPGHRYVRYLAERATAGVAMVVTPVGDSIYGHRTYPPEVGRLPAGYQHDVDAVLPDQRTPAGQTLFDRSVAAFRAQVAAVHEQGALLVGQLHHNSAERTTDNLQPTVAPSAIRGEHPAQVPHALTTGELRDVLDNYVRAGRRALDAGMDGIEVHASHGYLMNRMLSPYYNRRDDEYGGSPEARLRAVVEVLTALRAHGGPDVVLGVRLPGPEEVDGGLTVDDVVAIARALEPHVDYLSCSRGVHFGIVDAHDATSYTAPFLVDGPPAREVARAVKGSVGVPVVLTGRIVSPAQARALVASGDCDLVGMARAHIADARFVAKAHAGDDDAIVTCIACNECTDTPFTCTVNPAAGREAELDPRPSAAARRVVVVGAGPAGAECALRAAADGHHVVVLERADRVGGVLARIGGDPHRVAWDDLARSYARRLDTAGVEVRLGTEATVDVVRALEPDHVVVATGSRPEPARFPSDGSVPTTTSVDVAGAGPLDVAGAVLVVAGREDHLDPALTALSLAERGHRVVVTSDDLVLGRSVEPRTLHLVTARLLRAGAEIRTLTRVVAVDDAVVRVRHVLTGASGEVRGVGLVVLAHGRAADDGLAAALRAAGVACTVIGDASAPRRLVHAVLDGARLGANL